MKLNDLIAPAFIGIVAYVVDALFRGPLGILILMYSALPGIFEAIIAFATYAAADYVVSPYLGRQPYPKDLIISLALGFFAFTLIVNYFLAPFRAYGFSFKRYYFSRYPHYKAILGLVLIVARPLAYTRHSLGIVHEERAYESIAAVLLFVYVVTPIYEYFVWGVKRKVQEIVLGKAEGKLVDMGLEVTVAREIGSVNGRVVKFEVRNEEKKEKQYVLAVEAPDFRIPREVRTRKLKHDEVDEIYFLVKPSRYSGERPLRIHVFDVKGGLRETIPGESEKPRKYSLVRKGLGISKLFVYIILIATPIASIFGPTFRLHIADLKIVAFTMVFTIIVGYLALKLVDKFTGVSRKRRVVTRLDEAAATFSMMALITFLLGVLLASTKLFLATMIFSSIVLIIAAISPIVSPEHVEVREEEEKIVRVEPVDPDYFEEMLPTRALLKINVKKIEEIYGTRSFRVFITGDDYVVPAVQEIEDPKSNVVEIPVRIIPDGFGDRELIVRLGRLKDERGNYVSYDDTDVLISEDGKKRNVAIYTARYRSVPAGSAGVPREVQQISMRAIALVFSPTLLLNILNQMGMGSSTTILSVIFGAIGATPILLYLYFKRSSS